MIDQEKKQALITGLRTSRDVAMDILKDLSVDDMLALRDVLNEMMPSKTFADVNLEHELIEQYNTVKNLQSDVLTDDDVPVNQRAQVANSVASTLGQLTKMQADFYTSERFKAMEALMIKAIKKMSPEVAEAFVKEYEEMGS